MGGSAERVGAFSPAAITFPRAIVFVLPSSTVVRVLDPLWSRLWVVCVVDGAARGGQDRYARRVRSRRRCYYRSFFFFFFRTSAVLCDFPRSIRCGQVRVFVSVFEHSCHVMVVECGRIPVVGTLVIRYPALLLLLIQKSIISARKILYVNKWVLLLQLGIN